jgi:uncharacterized protein
MNWYVDLAIALPALALGLAAQGWVRHVLAKADLIVASASLPAWRIARRLLVSAGVHGVSIAAAEGGELDDHFDGRTKEIRLVDAESNSVAALAIAAHEVGHAVQDAEGALSFRLRSALAPVAAVASIGWFVLTVIGVIFGLAGLVHLAVLVFAGVAAFHLVTLPVELDASRRALVLIHGTGLATVEEERIVRRVLRAAAFTYVAMALVSIAQLLELLLWDDE